MSPDKNQIKPTVVNSINKVISSEQQKFYKRHNQCCLCSSELSIGVQPNKIEHRIFEKVTCPKCAVTISTSDHVLN